ncbi:hypothetical protein K438DRAFT_1961260 [Mycena galopus ATCC 62051]|nr:hypothetical protein K438DRAFT_1961260 [Mycena galopus ATCC 62051]
MSLMGPSMVSTTLEFRHFYGWRSLVFFVAVLSRLINTRRRRLETFFRWVFSGVFTFMFLMGPSMVSTACVGPAAMWFAVRCGGLLNSDAFMAGDPWFFCGGFIKTHQHPPSCILAIAHLS